MQGFLFNQALTDVRLTGAGNKRLFCIFEGRTPTYLPRRSTVCFCKLERFGGSRHAVLGHPSNQEIRDIVYREIT